MHSLARNAEATLDGLNGRLSTRSLRTQRKVWTQTVDLLNDAVRHRKISWNPATACDAPAGRMPHEEDARHWWEPETVSAFLAFATTCCGRASA